MQKYDPESDNEKEIIEEVKDKPIKEKKPRTEAQIRATQMMREILKQKQLEKKKHWKK